MTKLEWTKKQVAEATASDPPENPQYIEAFLAKIQESGESLTRTDFHQIFEACSPPSDVDTDYFDYAVLGDHFALVANFDEAWELPKEKPLPRITTKATAGNVALPDDFCTIGGKPDWSNPLSPPSDPVQRRLQSPSAKSNFLAVAVFP